jgi:diamine N-acetyltransferase
MAEASFSGNAWMKGIYLNEKPIGFVMVKINIQTDTFYLWRFMIDQNYQGLGLGRRAILLLTKELKAVFNASKLSTSVILSDIGPQRFYQRLGFEVTGNYIEDRELELKLVF